MCMSLVVNMLQMLVSRYRVKNGKSVGALYTLIAG